MDDIVVCQVCKEIVSNHICSECISNNLRKLLPAGLRHHISDFHRIISGTFQFKDGMRYCKSCRLSDAPPVCWVCYVKEFLNWSKGANPEIIRILKGKISFRLTKSVKLHKFMPLTVHKNVSIDGVCENCELYSEELYFVEGMWLCNDCKDGL